MNRRDVLRGMAVAGVAGLSSQGRVLSPALESVPAFGTVVDAVAAGADPTGHEPVNFVFEEHADDDTLIQFEQGTYAIDTHSLDGIEKFGIVGTGEEPARFVPVGESCPPGHPWLAFEGVSSLSLENLTFDLRGVSRGGPVHLGLSGTSMLRDVTCLGSCPEQISVLKIEVKDGAGSARFENFRTRNSEDNQSLTGVYVGRDHAGELFLHNCIVAGFSDNGLYASSPGGEDGRDGAVHVIDGTYRNNNIAGIRLGSTGSSAQNVTVAVSRETAARFGKNARGIRLRNRSKQVIDDCSVTFEDSAADSFGGIVFHNANGGALVRDTTVSIHRQSVPAVRAFPVEAERDDTPTFQNCTFDGDASAGVTARIEGRDGTVFRNCTIEGRGDDRTGLYFLDSEDCRIVDSEIDVTAAPVVVDNGTVTIENSTVVTASGEQLVERRTLEDERL